VPVRTTRVAPSAFSNDRSCPDTLGCDTNSCSAARVTPPESTTRQNTDSLRRVTPSSIGVTLSIIEKVRGRAMTPGCISICLWIPRTIRIGPMTPPFLRFFPTETRESDVPKQILTSAFPMASPARSCSEERT
jgi:hypothetical protein